jgi:Xaa-Pro aminopeptidase
MLMLDPNYPYGVSFEPGHITSVEPGFYKEGEFGIRTESVYVCKSVDVRFDTEAIVCGAADRDRPCMSSEAISG